MKPSPCCLRRLGLPLFGLLIAASSARASHLAIDLTLQVSPTPVRAGTDTSPPVSGKNARPLVHARLNEPVKLRWSVRNTDRRKKLEKLLVHVFIVREKQAGQREVPDPTQGAVWDTVHATALEPGKETKGDVEVPIGEPGIYLVRVESMFTERDHEHFAAVDLQVE